MEPLEWMRWPARLTGAFALPIRIMLLFLVAHSALGSPEPSSNTGMVANAVLEDPEFTDVIENITVPAGRNVKLACSVKNLGSYKVAWMHFEQSAILTVHNHVITRNPRISVTHDKHDKHKTWFLHITNVQEEDKGRYMCQINTVTAKTQFGYLHVVVPPNIDDSVSSSDVIVREGANVTLRCKATGSPPPSIKWKRDDNTKIAITRNNSVLEWEGDVLTLSRVSRYDMGAYLCIATNGVPPSVSKRIKVSVDFPPMLWTPHQLVGVPVGFNTSIECNIEAHPTSLNYWTRENDQMIHDSLKYKTETIPGNPSYKAVMRLHIAEVQHSDYGVYKCIAKNPRGETDGSIRLYSSSPPTTIPPSTTESITTTLPATRPYETPFGLSTMTVNHFDKGIRYQSDLNQLNRSEQKSSDSKPNRDRSVDESDGANGATHKATVRWMTALALVCHALAALAQ
ncbi:lachesin-like isoform X2 [Anopheles aquasalis]|uniref:lachesin-like isoform X2 n=1 Tax=Anopheles aquasalis TaxID=42839 RepID=UPI00215B5670|nr:lachesin-like isoform X2 [Anopheles aquasalis]